MSWQTEREDWNRQGSCARHACKDPLVHRNRIRAGRHRDSGLYYCVPCMRLINDANPMPGGVFLVELVARDARTPFSHLLTEEEPS